MTRLLYISLILSIFVQFCVDSAYAGSITNKIAKELRGTIYSGKGTTVAYASNNYSGSSLNCGQYAFRIAKVAPKAEIWQTYDKHVIVIVKEGRKRICYSNGKIQRESKYSKLKRLR